MRDGRLADAHEGGDIADAQFTCRDGVENPHAGGVAEDAERLGEDLHRPSGHEPLPPLGTAAAVEVLPLAVFVIERGHRSRQLRCFGHMNI